MCYNIIKFLKKRWLTPECIWLTIVHNLSPNDNRFVKYTDLNLYLYDQTSIIHSDF